MEIIIFNVFRIIGLVMLVLSVIIIFMSYYKLAKIGIDGKIKGEDIKEYETIRLYGIIIPSVAVIVSLIILAPLILIEINTNL
jgi:hypothetical protein